MKKVSFIGCSNGINLKFKNDIDKLKEIFKSHNIEVVEGSYLYCDSLGNTFSPKKRLQDFINSYMDSSIDTIFDLSGGDLANELLPYIDFNIPLKNYKPYYGYSDLSVIINSLYSQCNNISYLYQIRNIVKDTSNESLINFFNYINNKNSALTTFNYNWIQGNSMQGILIGGNLRCSLKLAGTKFMPSFKNKLLLLESLGGDYYKIATYLTQYKTLGAFDEINGLILGEFTEYEKNPNNPSIEELIVKIVDNPKIPIIRTLEIGHSPKSKAAIIGKEYSF